MPAIKRSLAVVIGINQYSNGIAPLGTAVNDARHLADLLREQYQYQVRLLLDTDATLSGFNELLEALSQKIFPLSDGETVRVEPDDRLLFFFAGHGIDPDVEADTDGLAGYLVPQDGQHSDRDTWFSMQTLHDCLSELPCRHLLIILDCCFAGTFRWATRYREAVRRQTLSRERYEQYISGYAQQVITSAAHDEKAADSLQSSSHSPFAELLLQGLKGEADYNNDGLITAAELYLYLQSELGKRTTKQTPVLAPLKGHKKGDYVFPLPGFNREGLPSVSNRREETNLQKAAEAIEEEDSQKLFTKFLFDEKLFETIIWHQLSLGKSSLIKKGVVTPSTLRKLHRKYRKNLLESQRNHQAMAEENREDSGQLTQSITQTADWEYEQLVRQDDAYAKTIRHVMLRMVAIEEGELAHRRVSDDELVYPDPENSRVKQVIARFCAARLLVRRRDIEDNGYIEPADDTLVQEWSKLLLWKQQELRNLLLQRELTPIAYRWSAQKQDKQACRFLWNNDPRLPLFQQVFDEKDGRFNAFESEFIKRSIQRRRNKRRRINGVIGGAIASLQVLTIFALYQLQISRLQEKSELVKTLLPAQPLEGLVLAIQTMGENKFWMPWNILEPVQSNLQEAVKIAREQNSFELDKGIVNSVAFSPENKTIAAGSSDGKLYLWNLQGKPTRKTLTAINNSINSLVFSPKNYNIIVAGSDDGKLRLWNLQGKRVQTLTAHKKGINSVVFSPDGTTIVTGGGDGKVRLWNFQGKPIGQPFSVSKYGVKSVAFNPQRKVIISGNLDGNVSLWNFQTKQIVKVFPAHKNGVNSVAFSPDGGTIITGGGDGKIRRWNWGGKPIGQTFTANEFGVTSVAFIDDKTIVSSSMTVRRWNLHSKQHDPLFRGHSRLVKSIAVSRDRNILVTGGDDGKVKLWDLKDIETKDKTWKDWLKIACLRLQYHPVLNEEAKTSVQKRARDTCEPLWQIRDL